MIILEDMESKSHQHNKIDMKVNLNNIQNWYEKRTHQYNKIYLDR